MTQADANLRNAVAAGLDVILGVRADVREQACIDAIIAAIRREFVILPADTVRTGWETPWSDGSGLTFVQFDEPGNGVRVFVAPVPKAAE